jgi:hypothetical protein
MSATAPQELRAPDPCHGAIPVLSALLALVSLALSGLAPFAAALAQPAPDPDIPLIEPPGELVLTTPLSPAAPSSPDVGATPTQDTPLGAAAASGDPGRPNSGQEAKAVLRTAGPLLIVNGRAVPVTALSVRAGGKLVRRTGPLAPNGRMTLKLPPVSACTVTVVATFAGGYSSLKYDKINVCKRKRVVVRL